MTWTDGVIAYYVFMSGQLTTDNCAFFARDHQPSQHSAFSLIPTHCLATKPAQILCERQTTNNKVRFFVTSKAGAVKLASPAIQFADDMYVKCPAGHVTHDFLSCDVKTDCWLARGLSWVCDAPLMSLPPSFACDNGVERVPYTLVCDHRPDCSDNSDENFCVFPPCVLLYQFDCYDGQCVEASTRCDNREHCVNGEDEDQCPKVKHWASIRSLLPPAVIDLDGDGQFSFRPLNQSFKSSDVCPETHFQCPKDGYCLPVYVRCNGVYDCPGKDDEMGCESYVCPGFYRCRGSTVCVHLENMCDGVFHCPEKDDELLCNRTCPTFCVCYGMAFFCTQPVRTDMFSNLKYLNADHTATTPDDVTSNTLLIHLSLVNCSLTSFDVSLPNLRSLDLSDNLLSFLDGHQFSTLPNLRILSLAGNPLHDLVPFVNAASISSFPSVWTLDLSRVSLPELNVSALSVFSSLHTINLSQCNVQRVAPPGFQPLTNLRVLDLRGSAVTEFPRDVLKDLDDLESIYADNYKLCCPATLPEGFYLDNCLAPSDEISSCEDLLRSDLYRIFLSVFAFLALCGNLGSFVYRVFISKVSSKLGFDVFVTHLCVSDFAMGLYLAIIGVADRLYLWNDVLWKNSAACKMAGFLSMLSSEVSAFIICLITLDRFLVLRFPFSHQLHFKRRSAQMACCLAWIIGMVIAAIPLLPVTSDWQFYSQTGICIPLPITRNEFPGQGYSFAVMIAFNFLLFLLIAAGQLSIYLSVRANSMAVNDSTKKSQDLTIAQRLITIAVSDFLCWFPIGLLGLMAATGRPIPGEVNVAIVIFVLPFNSALNPFLYTLNLLLERRRREQEQRLQKLLLSQERSRKSTVAGIDKKKLEFSKREAWNFFTQWMDTGLLSEEQIMMYNASQQKTTK